MPNNNENKVLNVPNLRFPEFSGEWEKCTIGELTIKVGSGVTPRGGEAVYKTEGHPFVRSQNVGLGQLLLDDIAYIDEDTHQRQKNTELQLDDVLLNITGASIGRSAIATKEIAGGNVNQHVCIIRTQDNLISSFLCNFLLSSYGQKQIDSFQAGGNRQGLNFEQIKSIKIAIPTVNEQYKIAQLLQLVEGRIATQNKIIDKLQSLISGLNDFLHLQVGGSSTSFEELGTSYSGLSGKSGDDFGKGKPYITYLNIYSNSIVNEEQVDYVVIGNNEKQNTLLYGDLLFTLSSETPDEVGIGAVYLGESDKYYLNSFCFGLHMTATNKVYSPYLAYLVSNSVFRKFIYPLAQGSTRFNLQKNDFMKKKFSLPTFENQKEIARTLNALSSKLETERKLLLNYQEQKQYLLGSMFI